MDVELKKLQDIAFRCRSHTSQHWNRLSQPLLSADEFAKHCGDVGLTISFKSDVERLWRVGLLRADRIIGPESELEPFANVRREANDVWIDNRAIPWRREGWGSVFFKSRQSTFRRRIVNLGIRLARRALVRLRRPLPNWIFADIADPPLAFTLQFHPFRIFVVKRILQLASARLHPTQYLLYQKGVVNMARLQLKNLEKLSRSIEFSNALEKANCLSEISAYFDSSQVPRGIDQTILELFTKQEIESVRKELVIQSQLVDRNTDIHILGMIAGSPLIEKMRGEIRLSITFVQMAECIRRSFEERFDDHLKEEDELGFGIWHGDRRAQWYGSDRVFDAQLVDLRCYIRSLGLDFATKVRCYVEGSTEHGALEFAFEGVKDIKIIDLRGQVVQRGGRGVAFRDSLRLDIEEKCFSIVVIDGDRSDYISAVRKAAADEEFVGAFFVSDPDFELQNFTMRELVDVAAQASSHGLTTSEADYLARRLEGLGSAKDVLNTLKANDQRFQRIGKGKEWGRLLMAYAYGSDRERPLFEILSMIESGLRADFSFTKEEHRVCPKTGKPILRS